MNFFGDTKKSEELMDIYSQVIAELGGSGEPNEVWRGLIDQYGSLYKLYLHITELNPMFLIGKLKDALSIDEDRFMKLIKDSDSDTMRSFTDVMSIYSSKDYDDLILSLYNTYPHLMIELGNDPEFMSIIRSTKDNLAEITRMLIVSKLDQEITNVINSSKNEL